MQLRPRRFAWYSAASARAHMQHTAFAPMPTGHSDRQRDPLDGLGMAAHNERAGREELAQAVAIPAV